GEMRPPGDTFVKRRPYTEDPEPLHHLVGQRVGDRLREGRMIVGRVVVDEQDLVGRIRKDLGHAVQRQRRTLVQVVAVAVVAAVEDDRNHQLKLPERANFASPWRDDASPPPRPSRISLATSATGVAFSSPRGWSTGGGAAGLANAWSGTSAICGHGVVITTASAAATARWKSSATSP